MKTGAKTKQAAPKIVHEPAIVSATYDWVVMLRDRPSRLQEEGTCLLQRQLLVVDDVVVVGKRVTILLNSRLI
jgi:hypothetical protein